MKYQFSRLLVSLASMLPCLVLGEAAVDGPFDRTFTFSTLGRAAEVALAPIDEGGTLTVTLDGALIDKTIRLDREGEVGADEPVAFIPSVVRITALTLVFPSTAHPEALFVNNVHYQQMKWEPEGEPERIVLRDAAGGTTEAYAGVLAKIPFFRITLNTFIVAAIVTLFKLFTGVLAAYSFVFFDFRGKKLMYFILICTIFIPFTVTMIPNFITISKLGLKDNLLGVALPQMADATGIFLLRQHMRSIPRSLMEVAELEKTPHFTRLRTIVVPMVKPAIFSIGIIFFVNSWNEYVWPSLILKSEDNYTLSLALQMFVSAEGGVDVPMAMATSVLTMLLPLILYAFCQRFIIETISQSGIKG